MCKLEQQQTAAEPASAILESIDSLKINVRKQQIIKLYELSIQQGFVHPFLSGKSIAQEIHGDVQSDRQD